MCDNTLNNQPMTGTVTYDLPMQLVLNLDQEGAEDFRDLCAHHRQMMVDEFFTNLLRTINMTAPPGNVLIRAGDIEEEIRRELPTS